MTNQSHADRKRSLAERKRYLLQEGATFRAEIIVYRNIVRSKMAGGSFTKNLFGRIAGMAYAMVSKKSGLGSGLSGLLSGARLPSLTPLLLTGVSLLSKGHVRKALITGSALIAALGVASYFSSKNKQTGDDE
ncbi:hypothetical protein ACVBEF_08280 [Glaciimonas sp. GG7]